MAAENRLRNRASFLLLAALLGFATHVFAIDSAAEAIVTPAYEKNMRTSGMMRKLDANADGKVTMEEGEAYFRKLFATLDASHDGFLDATEWKGAAKNVDAVSLSTGGYARALSSMDMMKICDADRDRKVTEIEFLRIHQNLFNRMSGGEPAIDAAHWLDSHNPINGSPRVFSEPALHRAASRARGVDAHPEK
ncbi:MAG: hypothetical protein ABW186_04955 [Rhodanobacteraceae bacterium]